MVERLRLYRGAGELKYSEAKITKSNDHMVNHANITIEADATVSDSSVIDFKKSDGSTTIFSAQVKKKVESMMWALECLTNGYELHNVWVQQVYLAETPEDIIKDVVDTYTSNLTYAGSDVSGITLAEYIADGYAIDVIKDIFYILQWQLRIDETDNVYAELKGSVNTGRTFTNGSNIRVTEWSSDQKQMFNHVRVRGGFENFSTSETVTGTGTEFALTRKPYGAVKADVGGEIDPADYTVDAESKTVTFDSSRTDPTFAYTWNRPIIVEDQDDASIAAHTEIFQLIEAPWLNSYSVARKYAAGLLEAFSEPPVTAKGLAPNLDFDTEVGELVTLADPIRSKSNVQVVVNKIVLKAHTNTTEYEFGPREYMLSDWKAGIQDRVKQIERRISDEEEIAFSRIFKHDMKVSLALSNTWKYNTPGNSIIVGHPTLDVIRADFDTEPDCSVNANEGAWTGSTPDAAGAQYNSSGFRLWCCVFNGSDDKIIVSDDSSIQNIWDGGGAVFFCIKPDDATGGAIMNKGSPWEVSIGDESGGYAKIYFISRTNAGSNAWDSDDRVIEIGAWNTVGIIYDADDPANNEARVFVDGTEVNVARYSSTGGTRLTDVGNDLVIGNKSTSWYDGYMDELVLFDVAVDDDIMTALNSKIYYLDDCVLYYAFDNPVLGDQSTSKVVIS